MRTRTLATLVAVSLLAATAGKAEPTDPGKLKGQLAGDAKDEASANPQCELCTRTEVSGYAGASLGAGENAAGGSGCMWSSEDYESSALVQVVPASYFPEPKLVPGFKRLPDVGPRAWVAPDSGWSAGTILGEDAIVVAISGKKATEASAVAMLEEALKRRTK